MKITRVNNLGSAARDFLNGVQEIEEDTGSEIIEQQRAFIPVSKNPPPGHVHIRDTIRKERDTKGDLLIVEGDAEHQYGPALEFGTRNKAARYHASPAAMQGATYKRRRHRDYARKYG